jgi:hypothetical protein
LVDIPGRQFKDNNMNTTCMKYFLILFLSFTQLAHAFDHVSSDQSNTLAAGTTLTATGNRFASSSANSQLSSRSYWTSAAYGLVKLSCPDAYSVTTPLTGQALVNVLITYQVEVNGIFEQRTKNTSLTLDFSQAAPLDIAYLKLDGAQKITVEVLSSGFSIPASWPALELKAEVHTQSFEWMTAQAISSTTLTHVASPTTDGNLRVNWTAISSAEYYELEWTYVSDQGEAVGTTLLPNEMEVDPFLFRNNSSRVEVRDLFYEIPLIYERGYIIYRLRVVGKNLTNSVEVLSKSEWTAPDGAYSVLSAYPSSNLFLFEGLENNINWQSSLSFAEEGKHKTVLSYHDGSSRNRQAVTRINSDKRSIVGETFYDYNGRPVIQTLPVPVLENTLTYFPTFNLLVGKTAVDKLDYDPAQQGITCGPVSAAFDKSTGASSYYSATGNQFGTSGNTGNNILNKNLIPDAEGFPYTQTYYTPDNTGRIKAQSGVGIQYRINSGHETSYLYGIPQQPELSRLFGVQVGYAGHYKKNTVVDPNGQTSVSYLDLDGKVVATALSGKGPSTLDELDGKMIRQVQTDLLNENIFSNARSADGLSKTYSSNFTVTSGTSSTGTAYHFDYSGLITHYDIHCNLPGSAAPYDFNMNGVVDINWELRNQCGDVLFSVNSATLKGYSGSNQQLTLPPQNINLPAGQYQVSKNLSINEVKLEEYWQEYLGHTGVCIRTQESFEQEELAKINLLGCGLTCENCRTAVDNLATSINLTQEEKEDMYSLCDQLCDPAIGCGAGLESMKGDISPGGQYGQLRKNKNSQTPLVEVTFDAGGNPIAPDNDTHLNSTGSGGGEDNIFDPGDPEDNKIVVEQFPMSLYNPDNRLRLHSFLYNHLNYENATITRANWRNPILIMKNGDDTKINNEILYDKTDLTSGITYKRTEYTDINGQEYLVDIYPVLDEITQQVIGYNPEIINSANHLQEDPLTGAFKVRVSYLKNIADFEKHWQSHWSNFLVVYHPEFEYFLDCTAEIDVLDFDYKLINTGTVEQALSNGFLSQQGVPTLFKSTYAACKDPFMSEHENNYNFLYNLHEHFKTMTIAGVSAQRTMPEMATIMVNCPTGASCNAAVLCTDGIIDTDEEWNVYKALYLSEKQKLMRQKQLVRAVNGKYYNGCIGQPNIFAIPDAGYFLNGHSSSGIFLEYYPYYNPAQLCYIGGVNKYKDKQQRFYLNPPVTAGSTATAYNCSTLVPNDDPTQPDILIPYPCDDDIEEATNNAVADAQRTKYEQCGQCPMAVDVEALINDLRKAQVFVSATDQLLTCINDQLDVTLGGTLYKQLLLLNGSDPDVYWRSTLSADSKTVTGDLISGGVSIAQLSLTIPPLPLLLNFTNLGSLCCFTADPTATGVDEGKIFHVKTSYYDILSRQDVSVILNGRFSINLRPCFIPPRCMLTSDARKAVLFLNALTISGSGISFKTHDLNTSNNVIALSDPNLIDFYATSVRGVLKQDTEIAPDEYIDITTLHPTWESNIDPMDNILRGKLIYDGSNNSRLVFPIEVSGIPATYLVQDIREFTNIRPEPIAEGSNDPCLTQPCERKAFLADVLITDSQHSYERSYHTVRIYVSMMTPIICKPAVPASN